MRERSYRNYLLTVLMVILALNYTDRLSLGLLLQDIKLDLDLSDTQLGLLSGIAFALFYSVMGIPIARWADCGNRVTIITLTTTVWCAMVALCGVAGNFLQLLLVRIGVAVGEAGCIPPAHSLIADHFSRSERPRAVAIYMLGAPLSVIIGFLVTGYLNELYGWRVTFMLLGLPGLVVAALAWLTLRDPRQRRQLANAPTSPILDPASHIKDAEEHGPPTLVEVCVTLAANKTYRNLLFCTSVQYFFGYGITQWQPTFFIRSYGMDTATLGVWLTIIWGGGGLLGTFLGGRLASRYAAQNERLQLRVVAVLFGFFAVLSLLIYRTSTLYLALGLMGLSAVGYTMTHSPLLATIQTLVPARMRAMSIATVHLFANLIGMGLGPLAVGVMSDAFRPVLGEESLRYALLALCPGYFWAGLHAWRASQSVTHDLQFVLEERVVTGIGVAEGARAFEPVGTKPVRFQ